MYSFKGLSNPNNIYDTSKIDYEYDYIFKKTICQICGIILEVGGHYSHEEEDYHICEKCYSNLRCPAICRVCTDEFESRNELFRHLRDTNHYHDPLTYHFNNGESIDFISKGDYDMFASPPGISKHDDFNNIDYGGFLESSFYKRKRYKFKFCIISQHSSVVIPKIHNIHSENIENYTTLSFNDGEHHILYDIRKNVGWMPFRDKYIIPISSIILII